MAYEAPPTNWLGTSMPLQDRAVNCDQARFSLALRNPVDGFLSFAQEVPPPPPSPATTFPRRLHVIFPRSAHLFSMRTKGLSLKPCGRPPPGRLIHGGHGAPRIFFVTLRGGRKTFFAALCCALFALDGNARNQAVRRSTGSRAFASGRGIMSLINYSVNGACGFIMWRRPQTLCRDFPHNARLSVSGVFGSEFEAIS